jgi:hypothetical protein
VDVPLKDVITVLISGLSLLLSGYAIWVAQFNRGHLKMTQPTLRLHETGVSKRAPEDISENLPVHHGD